MPFRLGDVTIGQQMSAKANNYVLRGGDEGAERLKLLGRVFWPTTQEFLQVAAIGGDKHILDIGCGTGEVSLRLAASDGYSGRIVGVDIDRRAVEIASQGAASRPSVQFMVQDASALAADEVYDVVLARFLLSHLVSPQTTLNSMVDLTKPGGLIAVEDTDFTGHFCYPRCAAFDQYVALYQQVVKGRGGDAAIGPRLVQMLQQCGLNNVQIRIAQPVFYEGEGKLMAAVTMEHIRQPLVETGLASHAEVDAIVKELQAFATEEGTLISVPRLFQVWGRRTEEVANQ